MTMSNTEACGVALPSERERPAQLSNADFSKLKDFIYRQCGIKITEAKRTMLEARLQKRLRTLKVPSFSRYCDYLFSPQGIAEELVRMIDVVTTNKTDFFREPGHFDYLTRNALPDLMDRAESKRRINLWSAGCSSGEEPYTLAMVMDDFIRERNGADFTIFATDISTRVLEKAMLAIYDQERVIPIPEEFRRRYLLKSKKSENKVFRIAPELRARVKFKRLNFMDSDFGFSETMDIIFCRNVIIYFDKPTQEKLLHRFCRSLSPDGYLFMGHSETILGMEVPLVQVAPTVYRRAR
jgi:chemotaxis protein methyltransferase CheR